jgi:hypothetical protein
MASGFEYTRIGAWLGDLPDDLVASVGQPPEPGDGFRFEVRADPGEVDVIGPGGEGPLEIATTVDFPAEVRSAIAADPGRFFAEASAILASAPGYHRFTDDNGTAADADTFSAVVLRCHVYADGASKHAVLTTVVDLLAAARHLREVGDRLAHAPP